MHVISLLSLTAITLLTLTHLFTHTSTKQTSPRRRHQRTSDQLLAGFSQPYRNNPPIERYPINEETCAESSTLPPLLPTNNQLPEAIQSYITFHQTGTQCLKKHNCKSIPGVLIWKGEFGTIGGFGDRMISLRLLLLLSIATQRLFYIHWPNQAWTPYDISSALHPAYVDWTIPSSLKVTTGGRHIIRFENDQQTDIDGGFSNPFYEHDANQQPQRLRMNDTDFMEIFRPFPVIYNKFAFLKPTSIVDLANNPKVAEYMKELSNINYIQLQRILTHTLFRPSSAVAYLARQRSFLPGIPYTAIHVRTGLDVDEGELSRFKHISKQLSEIVIRFITCSKRSHASMDRQNIFLASDSRKLKDAFLEHAANEKAFLSLKTSKRYVWHIDRQRSGHFVNDSDHCIAFLDIFADAYAISQAEKVFYFQSNFPEIAIGMGDVQAWHRLRNDRELLDSECYASNMSTVANPIDD